MYNDPYQPSQPPQPPSNPSYPPLTPQAPYTSYPTGYMPPPYEQSAPYYGPGPQVPYGQPGVPPVPPMPMYGPPPKKKGSLKWLWITLSIVGCVLVLACAGCGVFFYNVSQSASKIVGPAFAVGEYYQYLKMNDFSKAYAFVDPNATFFADQHLVVVKNEQSFEQAAQAVEAQDGPISTFSVSKASTDMAHITVAVTRSGTPYPVQLSFQQEGGAWKIVAADGM